MKFKFLLNTVFLLFVLLLFSSCCKKNKPQQNTPSGIWDKNYLDTTDFDVIRAVGLFGCNLYTQLSGKENLVFSPLSISAAMAMVYAGAENNTQYQMAKVLAYTFNKNQVNEGFSALMNEMNTPSDLYQVSLVNSLWAQEDFYFLPAYLENMKRYYQSGIRYVNFILQPENSRLKINEWVSEKTFGKIKNILTQGDITTDTRLILVNAIYFKSKWIFVFDESRTKPEKFILADNSSVMVDMMNESSGSYGYFENESFQFISIPYTGRVYSFNIILPKSGISLQNLEDKFTYDYLVSLQKKTLYTHVDLFLPKFSFTSSFSLREILSKSGMSDAFNENADFSAMTGKANLNIDNVIHKAFIEVNEQGTEAAAATAVIMAERAVMQEEKPLFKADHPFFFYIMNNENGNIIFMGKVMNPKNN